MGDQNLNFNATYSSGEPALKERKERSVEIQCLRLQIVNETYWSEFATTKSLMRE